MPLQISEEQLEHHGQKLNQPTPTGAKIGFLFVGFICAILYSLLAIVLGPFLGALLSMGEIFVVIIFSGALYFGVNKDDGKYFCFGWAAKIALSILLVFIFAITTLNAKGMKLL